MSVNRNARRDLWTPSRPRCRPLIYRQPADAADVAAGSDDDDDYDPDPAGRPAFAVAGEPAGRSGVPPSDGLEYLRVRKGGVGAAGGDDARRGDLLHAAASFAGLALRAAAAAAAAVAGRAADGRVGRGVRRRF